MLPKRAYWHYHVSNSWVTMVVTSNKNIEISNTNWADWQEQLFCGSIAFQLHWFQIGNIFQMFCILPVSYFYKVFILYQNINIAIKEYLLQIFQPKMCNLPVQVLLAMPISSAFERFRYVYSLHCDCFFFIIFNMIVGSSESGADLDLVLRIKYQCKGSHLQR